jgi:serine/threonine protein kinase
MLTRAGSWVGTRGYMSPEQADASLGDVDTRTDVYSLGVILYDLLTSALPLDTSDWHKHPFEVLQRLREDDPARPSTRIGLEKGRSAVLLIKEARPGIVIFPISAPRKWGKSNRRGRRCRLHGLLPISSWENFDVDLAGEGGKGICFWPRRRGALRRLTALFGQPVWPPPLAEIGKIVVAAGRWRRQDYAVFYL